MWTVGFRLQKKGGFTRVCVCVYAKNEFGRSFVKKPQEGS